MRNELNERNVGGDLHKSGCVLDEIKAANEYFFSKLQNLLGTSNSNNDEEVVIANYFSLNDYIDQKEELEVDDGGSGVGITLPVAQTAMVNDIKGLKISWGNFRGGSILLTQPSFSIPSMTSTNMLEMRFCRDISKKIPPFRMLRAKDVNNVKGGKKKLTNMKSLVKQLIRAAGIVNRYDLVVQK